jgi:hypothetical protein
VRRANLDGTNNIVLAGAQNNPVGIAVDGNEVYFTSLSDCAVRKVGTDGSGLATLATGGNCPEAVTFDSTHVYWTEVNGNVLRVKKDGTGKETLALTTPLGNDSAIAVDATGAVYWTSPQQGTVNRVVPGNAATTIATAQLSPHGLVVDASKVYWGTATDGFLKSAPLLGGAEQKLQSGNKDIERIALSPSGELFWITNPLAGTGSVHRSPGGVDQLLQSGTQTARGVAVDAKSVHWSEFASHKIMRLAL